MPRLFMRQAHRQEGRFERDGLPYRVWMWKRGDRRKKISFYRGGVSGGNGRGGGGDPGEY